MIFWADLTKNATYIKPKSHRGNLLKSLEGKKGGRSMNRLYMVFHKIGECIPKKIHSIFEMKKKTHY